jgi:hypothetical protein
LGVLKDLYPQLFCFARKKTCSVNQFLSWDDNRSFFLPLSHIAFEQLCELKDSILASRLPSEGSDEWTYVWDSGGFSSHRAYSFLRGSHPASPLFKWMWASKAQNKHKFFFWLFLRDRINTRNLLHKKNAFRPHIYVSSVCKMLKRIFNTFSLVAILVMLAGHIFGVVWDLNLEFPNMVLNARLLFNSVIFKEVFIVGCWAIWCHRNNLIFDGSSLCFSKWRSFF